MYRSPRIAASEKDDRERGDSAATFPLFAPCPYLSYHPEPSARHASRERSRSTPARIHRFAALTKQNPCCA